MPQTKTAFVGTARGELAVTVTYTEMVVTIDLGIPQAPAFVLKLPLADVEQNPDMFMEMSKALLASVLGYLEESGVPSELVKAQGAAIEEAITSISKDDEADRSGSGGSPVLEKLIELEPLDVFEAHFKLVDGMIPAIHQHVVTGTWKRAGLRGTKLALMVKAWGYGRRAGWITPTGDFQDVDEGSDQPSHAQVIRDNFSEVDEDWSDQDVNDFATERGWIRLWDHPSEGLQVEAGNFTQKDLVRLQKFLGERPEWLKAREMTLGGSNIYWEGSPQAFMAANKLKDLTRGEAIIAGLREALSGKEILSKPIKHTPPPVKIPHNFSTKPGPGTLVQNYPSVRTLVRKFKPQQGKPLTGPAFVLVYDVNGRPIGVRSIKGPGWKGIAASSKCTRTRCSVCHKVYEHCRCMKKFHDPNAPEFRGLVMEKSGLCSACSGSGKQAAETTTPLVVNTCPSCTAVTMNRRMTPGEKAENTRETCRECQAKAQRHEDPKMLAGRELLNFIDANHWTRFEMLQGPSGSVYVVFKGPESGIPRKIRISDHAMTGVRDPKKLHNSLPDLSIDPVSGVTLEQAKEWMKTAAKDMVVPEFSRTGQEIPVYINPSKAEIGGLLRKSDAVRMALSADGRTLLAWDAMVATHGQLREYLQLHGMADRNAVITLVGYPGGVQVTDGVKGTRWEHNPATAETILNSPRILQALGHVEISYYDEDIVGDWGALPTKTARMNLTGASFGPGDIPKNFWVVLDLRLGFYDTDFDKHWKRVFDELHNQELHGVSGISDTGQIIRQFGYRGAILRMPGAATVAVNKLSRVMYGNPHYLLSNDMAALYRLFHKDPQDAYGRDGLMLVLSEYAIKALEREGINSHAYGDLKYYGAATWAGRSFQANPASISNIHQLSQWLFTEFTRSWHERYTAPTPPFTLQDIEQACEAALRYVGQVYGDEGEWVVKNDTLKIPQGSTLIVAFEDKEEAEVMKRWESWTPEQREFDQTSRSPWLYGKVLGVQKQRQMRDMLKLLPFNVNFVSKSQLEQTISRLNNQKAAGLTAPKSKLFQETT